MPFTILVIDDDDELLATATELLRSDGHWAIAASSGEDGLATVRAIRPDLILLDYDMPGMNGLAVMEHLRADATTRQIPVVALTAAMADKANAMTRAGCIGVILKPFEPAEFLNLIMRFLHESAARSRRRDVPREGAKD